MKDIKIPNNLTIFYDNNTNSCEIFDSDLITKRIRSTRSQLIEKIIPNSDLEIVLVDEEGVACDLYNNSISVGITSNTIFELFKKPYIITKINLLHFLKILSKSGYVKDNKVGGYFYIYYNINEINKSIYISSEENIDGECIDIRNFNKKLSNVKKTSKWTPGNRYILNSGEIVIYLGSITTLAYSTNYCNLAKKAIIDSITFFQSNSIVERNIDIAINLNDISSDLEELILSHKNSNINDFIEEYIKYISNLNYSYQIENSMISVPKSKKNGVLIDSFFSTNNSYNAEDSIKIAISKVLDPKIFKDTRISSLKQGDSYLLGFLKGYYLKKSGLINDIIESEVNSILNNSFLRNLFSDTKKLKSFEEFTSLIKNFLDPHSNLINSNYSNYTYIFRRLRSLSKFYETIELKNVESYIISEFYKKLN